MTNQNIAYYSSITEYESGWGNRPDGYLVALTKEAFEVKAKAINEHKGAEFSRVDSQPKLCLVTDEMYAKLQKSSWVWTNNKSDWKIEG